MEIDAEGVVSVNGLVLDEPYVTAPDAGRCDVSPCTVPAGTVFVLGDNRAASVDSRSAAFGPVARERIVGKVTFSVWPLTSLGSVA